MKISQRMLGLLPLKKRSPSNNSSEEIITSDQLEPVQYVAGVDVGFEAAGTISRAAVAVLSFPSLQLQESAIARRPYHFSYIAGISIVSRNTSCTRRPRKD